MMSMKKGIEVKVELPPEYLVEIAVLMKKEIYTTFDSFIRTAIRRLAIKNGEWHSSPNTSDIIEEYKKVNIPTYGYVPAQIIRFREKYIRS